VAKKNNSDKKNSCPEHYKPFLREIQGLLLVTADIFIIAALLSYSPSDPSLHQYALTGSTNWMGPVGAHLAAFLMDVVGYAAWWLPVLLGALAIQTFLSKPDFMPGTAWIITGWTAMLISTSIGLSIFSLAAGISRASHPEAAGGLIGLAVTNFLMDWIGKWGTVLSGAVLFITGFMTATTLSLSGAVSAVSAVADTALRRKHGQADGTHTKSGAKPVKGRRPKPDMDQEPAPAIPRIVEPSKEPAPDIKKGKSLDPDQFQVTPVTGEFTLPVLDFLDSPTRKNMETDREVFLANAQALEQKLLDFGVTGSVVEICPGPVVTMYEYSPAPGIKINKVASLTDDLAMALKTHSVRIVAPIPGKSVIGVELANASRQIVFLKEILVSDNFQDHKGKIPLALGQDIVGQPVVTDLAKMPHLLIAGATGTGKSVGLNAMICSLLYRHRPDSLRLLMIDPKRIELSLYDGIPHLLHPVVSDPKEATRALRWAVLEMERRYQLLEELQTRNLETYNRNAEEPLPYLVIIIDELADLMMVSSKEVEAAIARLAQMARAAGIHLLVATQRPSVDVLTGLIKANFPARISFKVSSKVDSRTILDVIGAESLLGMGDMLFLPPGSSNLERIHGAFVSEKEIVRVVDFLKAQGKPDYDPTVVEPVPGEDESVGGTGLQDDSVDDKYREAVEVVTQTGQASISSVQRRLRVGYNRAARMIEQMERDGIVSPADNMGRRQVLMGK